MYRQTPERCAVSDRREDLTPEEVERLVAQRKQAETAKLQRSRFGMATVSLGILMLVVPILVTNSIEIVPAIVGFGVVIVGGVFVDPDHFVRIAERALDALPGGKH